MSASSDAPELFGFMVRGEIASRAGRVILGTRRQIEALDLGKPVPFSPHDSRPFVMVEEWAEGHLDWNPDTGRWESANGARLLGRSAVALDDRTSDVRLRR